MRNWTVHDAPHVAFEIAVKYRNEVEIPMGAEGIWDDCERADSGSGGVPEGCADVRKRRQRPIIWSPTKQPRVAPTLHLLRSGYEMFTIGPIFIVDARGAAVDVLCRAAATAMRLLLARKVVTEVTVEFSAYF